METMSYTFVPSFISIRGTVSKFEEKCLRLFEQYVVVMEMMYTHVYLVSSPCVLPLASLRSEEVIFKKIA